MLALSSTVSQASMAERPRAPASRMGAVMPAKRFHMQGFEHEISRAMALAFSAACEMLGLTEPVDRATNMVAMKIIELAQQGESDPSRLFEGAMKYFELRKREAAQRRRRTGREKSKSLH